MTQELEGNEAVGRFCFGRFSFSLFFFFFVKEFCFLLLLFHHKAESYVLYAYKFIIKKRLWDFVPITWDETFNNVASVATAPKLAVGTATNFFVWLVCFLTSSSATRLSRGRVTRLTSDNFTSCYTTTARWDHDFCLSLSHYTDIDPTRRERASGTGIEPTISWPWVERSTDWATTSPATNTHKLGAKKERQSENS